MSKPRLSQDEIKQIVEGLRKFRIVVELDIPPITNTRFRAEVNRGCLPFEAQDIAVVEKILGEPLCLLNCVVPYAMPLSLAVKSQRMNADWKLAVMEDRTVLGRDEWARQNLLERTLSKCLEHWETQGGHP